MQFVNIGGGGGGGPNPAAPQAVTLANASNPVVQPGLVVVTGNTSVFNTALTLGSDGLYEIDATGATGGGNSFAIWNPDQSVGQGMSPGDHLFFQVKSGVVSYAKGRPMAQGAYDGITNTQLSANNCKITGAGGTDGRYPQVTFNRPAENANYVLVLGLSYGSSPIGERIVFMSPGTNTTAGFGLISLFPNGADAATDYVSFEVYPA